MIDELSISIEPGLTAEASFSSCVTETIWLPLPRSVGPLVIWSFGHLVIWSFSHLVPWSLSHLVIWSFSHLVP